MKFLLDAQAAFHQKLNETNFRCAAFTNLPGAVDLVIRIEINWKNITVNYSKS